MADFGCSTPTAIEIGLGQSRLAVDPGELLDAVPMAILIVDSAGLVVRCNHEFERVTGYEQSELVSQPVELLVPEGARTSHLAHRAAFAANRAVRPMGAGLDIACRRKDGTVFPADISLGPLDPGYTVCTIRDGSDQLATETELRHRALHDPLTGLPNRALIEDRLAVALHRAERGQHWVAVLFLDLDNFKAVNDQRGHAAGDQVLRRVARALEAAARSADTIGRFGGDEFVVIGQDIDDPREAEALAERFVTGVRGAFDHEDPNRRITVSVGVVVSDRPCDPEKVLTAADRACYRAKSGGGDRWTPAAWEG